MSDQTTPAAGADTAAPPQAQFTVEKIYVKDVSFEAPNAPAIFNEQGQPAAQHEPQPEGRRAWKTACSKSCSASP